MMIGNNIEYIQMYTEINCLLKYFPTSYIEKLPSKLIDTIYKNSNEKYNINIDLNKNLKNQNISKKTKDMLAVLTYNYWSSENEKKNIVMQLNKNEKFYQQKLKEKYNTDNIFKPEENKVHSINDSRSIVKYKKSFFTTIKNWFKQIFTK